MDSIDCSIRNEEKTTVLDNPIGATEQDKQSRTSQTWQQPTSGKYPAHKHSLTNQKKLTSNL